MGFNRRHYQNEAKHRSDASSEKGAVMPEFALSIGVLLFVVLATIDFSIISYRWALLVFATMESSREAAVEMALPQAGTPSCSALSTHLGDSARYRMKSSHAELNDADIQISIQDNSVTPYWTIQATSSLPVSCVSCQLFNLSLDVSSTSQFVVEKPSFNCS